MDSTLVRAEKVSQLQGKLELPTPPICAARSPFLFLRSPPKIEVYIKLKQFIKCEEGETAIVPSFQMCVFKGDFEWIILLRRYERARVV